MMNRHPDEGSYFQPSSSFKTKTPISHLDYMPSHLVPVDACSNLHMMYRTLERLHMIA
jgi:hypothetical protein